MPRRHHLLIAVLISLFLVPALGCGSDDTSDGDENDGWNLGNNAEPGENNQDDPNNNDQPNDIDPNNNDQPNNVEPNNSEPNNSQPNNGSDEPDPLTTDDLVGMTLYGVWRVVDSPAIAGLYFSVEFVDDSNVTFQADQTIQGQWEILSNGDVQLYDLDGPVPQYILTPDMDEGTALELQVPSDVVESYRLRFELPGSDDLQLEDFEGRWQATEMVTGEDGIERYFAIRIDDDGFIEYGAVSETGTFVGTLQGSGHIHTNTDSGRQFWVMDTQANLQAPALAGEIVADGDDFTLRGFAEDHSDPINTELVPLEFEDVDQFSTD